METCEGSGTLVREWSPLRTIKEGRTRRYRYNAICHECGAEIGTYARVGNSARIEAHEVEVQ